MTKVIENLLSENETKAIAMRYVDCNHLVTKELQIAWSAMLFYSLNYMKSVHFPNIEISFVDSQPYDTANDMRDDVRRNNRLLVSTQYNDIATLSPIFKSSMDNLIFRATHDLHHCLTLDCNFVLDGEICAFSKFAHNALSWGYVMHKNAELTHTMIAVLASEIIGQVCVLRHTGNFPAQVYNHCVNGTIIDRILTAYKVI